MVDGEVFVRYLHHVPLTVRGVTVPNPDGTFSVYINADLPPEIQEAVYQHELYHIEHDHLYTCLPVKVAEAQASGKPAPLEERHRRKKVLVRRRCEVLPFPSPQEKWGSSHGDTRFGIAENQWLYGTEY